MKQIEFICEIYTYIHTYIVQQKFNIVFQTSILNLIKLILSRVL